MESLNATTELPWINNAPNFTSIEDPTLSVLVNAWDDFLLSGETLEVIPDPVPTPVVITPDWDGLSIRCLTPGDPMNSIYTRLTLAAMQEGADAISTAQNKIESAILTIRIEGALAGGIALLTSPLPPGGIIPYVFTQEERDIWNPVVASLGFSPLAYI